MSVCPTPWSRSTRTSSTSTGSGATQATSGTTQPSAPCSTCSARPSGGSAAGADTESVTSLDAVVVGAGPNGLAAAVTLAAAGLAVHVVEGASSAGGGCRTEQLTLPGFSLDVCSTIHPLAVASPFFRQFDLTAHGLKL